MKLFFENGSYFYELNEKKVQLPNDAVISTEDGALALTFTGCLKIATENNLHFTVDEIIKSSVYACSMLVSCSNGERRVQAYIGLDKKDIGETENVDTRIYQNACITAMLYFYGIAENRFNSTLPIQSPVVLPNPTPLNNNITKPQNTSVNDVDDEIKKVEMPFGAHRGEKIWDIFEQQNGLKYFEGLLKMNDAARSNPKIRGSVKAYLETHTFSTEEAESVKNIFEYLSY